MTCVNYLYCRDRYESESDGHPNENGLCFICSCSILSYQRKKNTINDGFYPSIIQYDFYNYHHGIKEYHSHRMDKIETEEIKQELLRKLEGKKDTTGMLKIEEIKQLCSGCLQEKDNFITHPTCGIHKTCKDCFYQTFENFQYLESMKDEDEDDEDDYDENDEGLMDDKYYDAVKETEHLRACNICGEKRLKI